MHFKLIIAMVEDEHSDAILEAARAAGATGATILSNARGEGLKPTKTFFGLSLVTRRDVVLLLVEEHVSRCVLERVAVVGRFDEAPGTGIAFQIDVEDAVGVRHQVHKLQQVVEGKL
jgi:nitrogen regulatory protein PII